MPALVLAPEKRHKDAHDQILLPKDDAAVWQSLLND